MLHFDKNVCLWWAFLLLVLPLRWLISAAAAACVHECCHLLAVKLLGGQICRIRLGAFGAVIGVAHIAGWREAVCALAGPAGSLSLLLMAHRMPLLALCGLAQGAFNLLPVYPLDGGRALRCLLKRGRVIPDDPLL